jgi:hypothetical protein
MRLIFIAWVLVSVALLAGASEGRCEVTIIYPFDGALFPADLRPSFFRWKDTNPENKVWLLKFAFKDPARDLRVFSRQLQWEPPVEMWERIKSASVESPSSLEVYGLPAEGSPLKSPAKIGFMTSKDPVEAPIFYRDVPDPFPEEKDFVKVKWRLGRVSSYERPITVMENQTLCFNCHVSSLDGKTFGIEFNPAGDGMDRGAYLFFRGPGKVVKLSQGNFFDWNDALPKEDRLAHESLLSAVSPDGRTIAASGGNMLGVNAGPYDLPGYAVVTKGKIFYFSTQDRTIKLLPGADDPKFIHAMVTSWSADGKDIYFSRAPLTPQYDALNRRGGLTKDEKEKYRKLSLKEVDRIFELKYDVFRIPFNGGKGGVATPVEGASNNGKSNYFPKASPDGKWIAFTQSNNGMMLVRPDSDIYLVPAVGGKARKLRANGPGADSWHSWSPNSRWLVFSSKSYDGQTYLLLTHVDDEGNDSPPIILRNFRDRTGLSANLPEFFNIKPGQFEKIEHHFKRQVRQADGSAGSN